MSILPAGGDSLQDSNRKRLRALLHGLKQDIDLLTGWLRSCRCSATMRTCPATNLEWPCPMRLKWRAPNRAGSRQPRSRHRATIDLQQVSYRSWQCSRPALCLPLAVGKLQQSCQSNLRIGILSESLAGDRSQRCSVVWQHVDGSSTNTCTLVSRAP